MSAHKKKSKKRSGASSHSPLEHTPLYLDENLGTKSIRDQLTQVGIPTDEWYAAIGDNTLADAIMDRLMHNAHRLSLKGESMRKILGKLTEGEHLS